MERTFVIIKPDGVQRLLISTVLKNFEKRGLKIVGIKMIRPSQKLLETHYEHLKDIDVFPLIIKGMMEAPVVACVLEGKNCVQVVKKMVGATDPKDADLNSIRGKLGLDIGKNLCHASDSITNACNEINLWFTKDELFDWDTPLSSLLYRF